MKYHSKYLMRLAEVYVDRLHTHGAAAAQAWYNDFLTDDLRPKVKPYIALVLDRDEKKKE